MMIKKCIVVLTFVLLARPGLCQNSGKTFPAQNPGPKQVQETNQEQDYFKLDYFRQVAGVALEYTPMSLKLFDFINDWIGKPYKWGGVSKKGIDCSAFVRELYGKVMDRYLPRNSRQQYGYVNPIKKEDLRVGDLVFFKIKTRDISHVGVYLGDNKFVQSSKQGVNVASLDHPYWKKYYYKAGRL
jgi:lipoprotein Spr